MSASAQLDDRLAIGDLLIDFAHRLDTRDWAGYVANYAPDGVLELPWTREVGHDAIAARVVELERFAGTQHYSTNHRIEIDGDRARSRSSLLAIHLLGDDPATHADVGGFYDCEYVRTAEGWKFSRVTLSITWTAGASLALEP